MKRFIVGLFLVGLFVLTPLHTNAFTKYIITYPRDFQSQGQVNRPGTLVTLTAIAQAEEGQVGQSVIYRITATQPHTGASVFHMSRFPLAPEGTSRPGTTQKLRPESGSPPFAPGPLEVTAHATLLAKDGGIVRTWTWSRTVELVER